MAVTCSIEEPFGSAVVAPGTGFPLNGQLGDFNTDWDPADPKPNDPGPGKRPRSSMAPTILVENGRPVLVAAAMGGGTIPLAVVQAIINTVDFGAPLALAIDAARADAQMCPPPSLCLEFARVAATAQQELTLCKHTLGYAFCPVHAARGIPRCTPEYHVYPRSKPSAQF